MIKHLLIAILLTVASHTFAMSRQLDVIGLVPGQSTKADVEKAGLARASSYVIGGYMLICMDEYLDGVLATFTCFYGKEFNSQDTTSEDRFGRPHVATNIEVHDTLTKGFTKKFGEPTKNINDTVTNAFGTEYNRNSVAWVDEEGNRLVLKSIFQEIGAGMLLLQSTESIKKNENEEIKEPDERRKF